MSARVNVPAGRTSLPGMRAHPALVVACLIPALIPALIPGHVRAEGPPAGDLRLLSVSKAEATLSLALSEPAAASVAWGEAPGEFTGRADASSIADHHQLTLTDLSPDTRYFYQVSVDGSPLPDILTFRSGRSWVTRRAALLVTADVPQGMPGEAELADRLFAEEADAIVVLGGDGGKPDVFGSLHRRSMAEKIVLAADPSVPTSLSVADVRVASTGSLPLADDGTCWRVALGTGAPAGAEIVITSGTESSIAVDGASMRITLADADLSGGPRAYARLDFVEGRLTAALRSSDGASLGHGELSRSCAPPKPKETAPAAHDYGDGDGEPGSSDGEAISSDCDVP